jgi:hypothetical protein
MFSLVFACNKVAKKSTKKKTKGVITQMMDLLLVPNAIPTRGGGGGGVYVPKQNQKIWAK